MASVYIAKDSKGTPVALKVPNRSILNHAGALRRFKREGDALLRLDHPHIVKAFAQAEHEGVPYLVMEYVDGYPLAQYMQARKEPYSVS